MTPTLFHPLLRPPAALLEPLYAFVLRSALLLGARLRGLTPPGPLILVCPPVAPLLAALSAALLAGSAVARATSSSLRSSLLLPAALVLSVPAMTAVILASAALTASIALTTLLMLTALLAVTTLSVVTTLLVVTAPLVAPTLILLTASIALHPGHGLLDPVRDTVLFLSASAATALPSALLLALLPPPVLFSPAAHAGATPMAADLLSVELVLGTALISSSVPAAS